MAHPFEDGQLFPPEHQGRPTERASLNFTPPSWLTQVERVSAKPALTTHSASVRASASLALDLGAAKFINAKSLAGLDALFAQEGGMLSELVTA